MNRLGLDPPPWGLQHVAWLLLTCAAITGVIAWRLV